jgi:argininosuccinate synthase
VENRFVGIKSRGVYETPGGTLLRTAHIDLEGITMDREVKRITEYLALEFARLCYNGFWFAPEMDLVRNSIDYSQRDVEGTVTVELYKGNCIIKGRVSPKKALYNADLASMDIEGGGDAFDYNPGTVGLEMYCRWFATLTHTLVFLVNLQPMPMVSSASMLSA